MSVDAEKSLDDPELDYQITLDAMVAVFAKSGLNAIQIACRRMPHELENALAPLLDSWKLEANRAAGLLAIVEDKLSANAQRIEEQERQIQRNTAAIERLEIALAKARQNWGRLVSAGSKK